MNKRYIKKLKEHLSTEDFNRMLDILREDHTPVVSFEKLGEYETLRFTQK